MYKYYNLSCFLQIAKYRSLKKSLKQFTKQQSLVSSIQISIMATPAISSVFMRNHAKSRKITKCLSVNCCNFFNFLPIVLKLQSLGVLSVVMKIGVSQLLTQKIEKVMLFLKRLSVILNFLNFFSKIHFSTTCYTSNL